MATFVCGPVEGIGVANVLPTNPQYFTQITIPEIVELPCEKPDMEELLSVAVDTQVVSVRLVNTAVSDPNTSVEGQKLSGRKIIIELKLRQKVRYVADEPTQSVHAAHFENNLNSIFVVVPQNVIINGVSYTIEELFRLGRVVVTVYVEDVYAKMMDKRKIFKNIALFVNVTFMP